MPFMEQPAVLAYYRSVADSLARHLPRPTASAIGWHGAAGLGRPRTADDIIAAAAAGTRWFGGPAGADRIAAITPGEGADIAVAATATLALIQDLLPDRGAVAAWDGKGGLLLLCAPSAPGAPDLHDVLAALSSRAPEIATQDPDAANGRALLRVLPAEAAVPLVYSLVDGPDGTGAVVPLTADELAAVTAGMSLDPRPEDVGQRLAMHGDLAAAMAPDDPAAT